MADTKINALTTITGAALAAGDLFLVIDVSDTTMDAAGTAKVVTKSELATGLNLANVANYLYLYDTFT